MAKIRKNMVVQGLSGLLGDQLMFRRLRDGRTIVCAKPDFSRRVLSQDQKAHHAKFKQAAAYARHAAQTEPLYAQLAAGTMKTAYNMALADFFHPPMIHRVKWVGPVVQIHATDDVKVAGVRVTILDEAGHVVEQGEAIQAGGEIWRYQAQQAGSVLVEAWDLARNVTREGCKGGE